MRPLSKALGVAFGLGALLLASVGSAGAAGWEPAQPYDGGPGCDLDNDGLNDGYYNPAIEHEFHVSGKVSNDTLTGKYTQRFDNVRYDPNPNEDPDNTEPILVSGRVTFRGEITFDDISDISTITEIAGDLELKWRYTITDLDGQYLTATGGTLGLDPETGEITYERAYGPCWEP